MLKLVELITNCIDKHSEHPSFLKVKIELYYWVLGVGQISAQMKKNIAEIQMSNVVQHWRKLL